MPPLEDFVALSLTPFSWRRGIGDRLRGGEPPSSILRSIAPPDSESRRTMDRLAAMARCTITRAASAGIVPIAWSDDRYPHDLAVIHDPPPLLWIQGSATVFESPAVSIVGARSGSPYALAVAARLAADLAVRGVLVVSGLARGVDSAAHQGALDAGGSTLAVLGSGVDVIYPREHVDLAASIRGSGAIVSELAPGTRPLQWFFPLRNRIISALSRAVVVIEAGEKSGSLITARCALEQGRDVLAVPGNVLCGRNRGGHALLRDGAKIVESADDILDELNLARDCTRLNPGPGCPASQGRQPRQAQLSSDPVLACMEPGEPFDLEVISMRSGFQAAHLLHRLLELELQGRVQRVAGGRFVRLDRSC